MLAHISGELPDVKHLFPEINVCVSLYFVVQVEAKTGASNDWSLSGLGKWRKDKFGEEKLQNLVKQKQQDVRKQFLQKMGQADMKARIGLPFVYFTFS